MKYETHYIHQQRPYLFAVVVDVVCLFSLPHCSGAFGDCTTHEHEFVTKCSMADSIPTVNQLRDKRHAHKGLK